MVSYKTRIINNYSVYEEFKFDEHILIVLKLFACCLILIINFLSINVMLDFIFFQFKVLHIHIKKKST
jgi:hypothetical protein